MINGMHFFNILLILINSKTAGPYISKLYCNRQLFSGSWELSNGSYFNNSAIILTPSNSTDGYGYGWRLRRPPNATWNGEFKFHVSNFSTLSQIGIYLTENFGLHGECFGGPCKFNGIAILTEINNTISFEIRKNNGKINFINSSIMSDLTLPFNSNAFSISIEVSDKNTLKVYSTINGQNSIVNNGQINLPIEKPWISVTSFNNLSSSEISMTLANLSFNDEIYDFDMLDEIEKPRLITALEFDNESNLNNKEFKMISRVITLTKRKEMFEVGTDSILEGVIEFSRVLNKSITVKQSIALIDELFHPYSDAWKRRSYRIINESKYIIDGINGNLNRINDNLSKFQNRVLNHLQKLKESVGDIEKDLYSNVQNSSKIVSILKQKEKMARGSKFVRFLEYFSIVEVVCAIMVVIKRVLTIRRH